MEQTVTEMVKEMVGRTAGTLAQMKVKETNYGNLRLWDMADMFKISHKHRYN